MLNDAAFRKGVLVCNRNKYKFYWQNEIWYKINVLLQIFMV